MFLTDIWGRKPLRLWPLHKPINSWQVVCTCSSPTSAPCRWITPSESAACLGSSCCKNNLSNVGTSSWGICCAPSLLYFQGACEAVNALVCGTPAAGVVDARCCLFLTGAVLGSASVAIPSFRRISCVALIGSVPRKGAVTHTLKKGNEPTPGYDYIICQHTCKGQSVSSC